MQGCHVLLSYAEVSGICKHGGVLVSNFILNYKQSVRLANLTALPNPGGGQAIRSKVVRLKDIQVPIERIFPDSGGE